MPPRGRHGRGEPSQPDPWRGPQARFHGAAGRAHPRSDAPRWATVAARRRVLHRSRGRPAGASSHARPRQVACARRAAVLRRTGCRWPRRVRAACAGTRRQSCAPPHRPSRRRPSRAARPPPRAGARSDSRATSLAGKGFRRSWTLHPGIAAPPRPGLHGCDRKAHGSLRA